MINFGAVPVNSVLPIIFGSYDSDGASATLAGLAVTDIEIYKGTSMTQRASDNGYAVLDSDGIDIDNITGINGVSIDLSDNSDSGFYSAGSFYTVVVSSFTVDYQTVNFVAATFRIVAAESSAGLPTVQASSLATQAKADVNAEVVDALATDTYAEPGQGSPAATLSLAAKINYLFKSWRNKKEQTSTTFSLYNDAESVVDQKSTISESSGTITRGEVVTGP